MPSSFATGAVALISLVSLVIANPQLQWKRQVPANTTSSAPFDLGTGSATATYEVTVTSTATVAGATPTTAVQPLTCVDDIIARGLSAEPAEGTAFCSSFLGVPVATVTTDRSAITEYTTVFSTGVVTETRLSTTPCTTLTTTATTIITSNMVRRDASPLTKHATLPSGHPLLKWERQASDELQMSDCSTLMSSFSNDCSCLLVSGTPTSTVSVCATTTSTVTRSANVFVHTTIDASTCSGTATVTTTRTLIELTSADTTSTSTAPPATITTTTPLNNSTVPITSPTDTVTSSGGAVTQNSTIPATTATTMNVPTGNVSTPITTPTTSFAPPPFSISSGLRTVVITETIPGGTTTVPGQTVTYTDTLITRTITYTDVETPSPSTGAIPSVNTTGAPYTYTNDTSSTTPFPTAPTSDFPGTTGLPPPLNTTGAPFPVTNETMTPSPAPTGTAPTTVVPTTSANYTIPGRPSIPSDTRTGGDSTSTPFPAGNTTDVSSTGTAPAYTPTGNISNPYYVPEATSVFNGSVLTTYTSLVTTTQTSTFNTTVTTEFQTVITAVVTGSMVVEASTSTATITTITGSTVYPNGTSNLYSEPAPTDATFSPTVASDFTNLPTLSGPSGGATATTDPTTTFARRWQRVRKAAPREQLA